MFQASKYYLVTSLMGWCLFLAKPVTAQTLPEKLSTFFKQHATEKLALVTSKPVYQAGDTIYFRVNSWQNTSENLIEVQLLSPESGNNNATKVLLKDGVTISYITLPENSASGDYILRVFNSVGWEAAELIHVYNPGQATAGYKTSNWAKSGNNENLQILKNPNNWEINWQLSGKPTETKGWFLMTDLTQVLFSQEVDFTALNGKITVPSEVVNSNQVQLLLAQSSGEILSNNTLYTAESNKNALELKLNKNTYNLREPVNLTLTPEKSSPVVNSFISVRVLEMLDSIPSTVLHNTPLGKSFYLQKSLPVLNFKKILATSSTVTQEYIFTLKGRIVNITDKKPIGHSLIHLLVPTTNQLEVVYSDKDGRIQVELDPFEGTKPLLFRAIQDGVELRNLEFIPDSTQPTTPWQLNYSSNTFNPTEEKIVNKFKILKQIDQAFQQRNEASVDDQSNYLRPSQFAESKLKPTTSYDLQSYEKFSTVTEIFRELIPAIEIIKRKDGVHARLYARLLKRFYTHYPLFLVDGIPSYDIETILNLPANQLVKIDVFNTTTALAPFDVISTGGVIALYTKNRNFNPAILHDNYITVTGTAPSISAPKFNRPEPTIPNFGPLVFWNPLLKTDANGATNLSFTTNDQVGKFLIEVTSTAPNGEVKTATTSYTVEAQK
ncbi:hypothetical protein [Adhaeribacter radiodurans]|uniref:MG2 domain-containing protein n=1 Tax=Adhaeribacter radiodurans TaxID=2745197 RepID=A0A7L7L5B5_9BACT|nr:hypothetical protein [Adhaeribacter radiodurans]QMU27970.1 hypothetical protein HUW48_07880 [Adhaeribacter radiodurans]